MKTTLSKILSFGPCNQIGRADDGGWLLAMETLKRAGLKYDPNMKVTIQQIYESNGIKDAIWCLRCFDYKEYCLFLADIAESVYHIYKKHNPHDHVIWDCIQGIHYYYHGFITRNELKKRARAAARAADGAEKWNEIEKLFKKTFYAK